MTRDPSQTPTFGVGDRDASPSEAATRVASDGPAPESPDPAAAPAPESPDVAGEKPEPEPAVDAADEASAEDEAPPAGELDFAALQVKAEKADEYLALAQRTKADFENYRKRSIREAAAAQERGIAKLARELLPAVDNLDRALSAAQAAAAAAGEGDEVHAQLLSGVTLVHADVISALSRAGIESFSPEGEAFDPQWHEAVAQQPLEGAAPGTVAEVYQRGYKLGETVLRPARVLVAA